MGDGVKVDDTREELALLVGFRGPIGNLFQDLGVASLSVVKARSVDQCDYFP